MSFHFRPAERDLTHLLIGMCGSSGSGKTFSALTLAEGLAGDSKGPIAVIDTEGRRACMYAKDFTFKHCIFEKPFSADRYVEALDAAAKIKPSVIIVDSVSHVWEGPGGTLEFAQEEKERVKNDFAMWAKPKQAHTRFVNALLQAPTHLILCFRAKEKKALVANPDKGGKLEVVNQGWQPIADHSMTFELTINMLMSTDQKGVPIIDGFDHGKLPAPMAHLIDTRKQISKDTGIALAAWCAGETPKPKQDSGPQKTQGESKHYDVMVQGGQTMRASDLEQAAKMISGALGRADVYYEDAVKILKENASILDEMPDKWRGKLDSQASLKPQKAS